MVLEAARLGCLDEVLVIAAGISVQDPRERPLEKREAAAALHARFDDVRSDFLSYLSLWDYLDERQGELSSGQFRRLCRRELISYQRAREWQDVHGQLVEVCRNLRLGAGPAPGRRSPPVAGAGRARSDRTAPRARPPRRDEPLSEGERAWSIRPCCLASPPRWVPARGTIPTSPLPAVPALPSGPGLSWPKRRPGG